MIEKIVYMREDLFKGVRNPQHIKHSIVEINLGDHSHEN